MTFVIAAILFVRGDPAVSMADLLPNHSCDFSEHLPVSPSMVTIIG